MTTYAVYQTANGALVSVGTVVANPLPAGLTALALSVADAQGLRDGTKTWDAATLTCVAVPIDPTVVNESTINTYLENALLTIDAVVATSALSLTQADLRNLQLQVKDLARIERRLIKKVLLLLDTSD